MVSNRIKYTYLIVLSIALVLFNCQSRADDEKAPNQNKRQETNIEERKPGSPIKKNNEGPKVKITAFVSGTKTAQDRDYYISVDTEKLAIGGHPLTITNIRGLEQLKNVRHLYLYGVNYNFSDVFEAIKIFNSHLEKIVFANCSISDLSFLELFPKLKAIVYRNGNINSIPNFNFMSNSGLEYFYLFITTFIIVRDEAGQPKDLVKYTSQERESITLDIDPSAVMKLITIDTNIYPLIITEKLCDKLSNVKTLAFLESTFKAGKNNYNLLRKYNNIIIYKFPLEIPDKEVPSEFKFNTLCDTTDFEIIGAM